MSRRDPARRRRPSSVLARMRLASFLLAMSLLAAAGAQVPVPDLRSYVTDLTNTLSRGEAAALERRLAAYEQRRGVQIAVLIVPTTDPETIEQYSIRVAEAWKLGRKGVDDGALLVIAMDDSELRIEVGYGLEGVLTDAASNRIIDEVIVPRFRAGDFYRGIADGVERMMALVDGEPLPPVRPQPDTDMGAMLPVLFIFTVTFGAFLKRLLGQLPGALVTGGVAGTLAWLLVGTLGVALIAALAAFLVTLFTRAVPGRWASGPGGFGAGGWSSGRGGGFRGGGGRFGGGGASGRW